MAIEYLAGKRIRGTNAERTGTLSNTYIGDNLDSNDGSGWAETGTSGNYTFTGGALDANMKSSSPATGVVFDFGSALPNTASWNVDFDLRIDGYTNNHSSRRNHFIIISDSNSLEMTTSQDQIGISFECDSSPSVTQYRESSSNDAAVNDSGTAFGNFTNESNVYHYWRYSSDGSTISMKMYESDANRTAETSATYSRTVSTASDYDGMRYFKVMPQSSTFQDNTIDITIDNLTTSIVDSTANIQDGTIFEETDTNKSYIWSSSSKTWTQL